MNEINSMDMENMEKIVQEIKIVRSCGAAVTCSVRYDSTSDISNSYEILKKIDNFVKSFGFSGLDQYWVEVDVVKSLKILTDIIHKDIAYGSMITDKKTAKRLANRFLSVFESSFRPFTNGNLIIPDADPKDTEGAWMEISDSTFDTGIVCIDNKKMGILWVQDED
ncbi:MAG: hypothetical protein DRI57_15135 [Deltaproteobacteria bacterium]|nr:MAG: hypothetical protein DRI57_15135 [Deltaproteobacteria bacterium]